MGILRAVAAMAVAIAMTVSVGSACAQTGKLTEDEVKALTIQAAEFIAANGIEAAEQAFTEEGEFRFGETYVSVIDFNGLWVIYPPRPANKGKSILTFIDEDGRKLGQDILAAGKRGEGWTEYRWKNPATNTIQPKLTFVKKVPGKDYVVYIGIYK